MRNSGRGEDRQMEFTRPRSVVLLWATLSMVLAFAGSPAAAAETEELREYSLELVNSSRAARGLSRLTLDQTLNRSAEAHAEDMLERGYFAHVSPDGDDVMDRYITAGGSQWRLVTENIGHCTNCAQPLSESDIERQHENWMQSPEHRTNILRAGLDRYGLGLAAEAGELYAVQNFSGPGTPRSGSEGETSEPLPPGELAALAADLVNDRRARQDVAPLEVDEVLMQAARDLVPDDLDQLELEDVSLTDAIPPTARGEWRQVVLVAGSCGGCGVEPTDADVRDFVARWLDDPQYGETLRDGRFDELGFALFANGEGLKIALAVLADQRD